ncbi:tyrosine-type recombinase/integrase [Rhizobium leguminosarum bv. viciae]|uniref:tyrosine-type recombinase/integrase n=1 Tax=Rhizobium ruizarguesonis TaxID=2081791 RepID=UPI00143FA7E8|nr:hypothetical protein [Rhizobium ruizarguesonis]NKJ72851.1 tyrosine-type recombinase/integrase [Rhizobium leguminosarum bv. viciae]NKQ80532.1 hypothetical protein [Rhizobium ruizarguesonis]
MATLHWPTDGPRRQTVSNDIPFLILDDGDYAAPLNYFMQDQSIERDFTDSRGSKRIRFTSANTSRAEGYHLLNFANFSEALSTVPDANCSDLWAVKNWHFDIYRELMNSGHWSRAFFATGRPEKLSLRSTIRPRVRLARQAWSWMRKNGLIGDYVQEMPSNLLLKKVATIKEHFETLALEAFGTNQQHHRFRKRRNPRQNRVLRREEIQALVEAVPFGAVKLIILLILFVGLRREEIVENSLCPDHLFKRLPKHLRLDSPIFPKEPYLLAHNDADDMIGVMPSIDAAFAPDEEARLRCSYRLIGKGLVIRRVSINFKLMRLIWHYYLKERQRLLDRNSVTPSQEPAHFFLNRFGRPITANAITRRINEARIAAEKSLGVSVPVDVHTLRHTHACIYLEAVIIGSARKAGIDPESLTLEQIGAYGQGALLTLKENLGHAELATTERYLRQLSSGLIGLQYQKLFDAFIDPLLSEIEASGAFA